MLAEKVPKVSYSYQAKLTTVVKVSCNLSGVDS